MQYLGGKSRLAKKFAGILATELGRPEFGGRFVEPFVGGFNLLPTLASLPDAGNLQHATCSDNHVGLIGMYQAYQRGWRPPDHVTRERYDELRNMRGSDPESTFVSFACAFGGKEWSGFATKGGKRAGENFAAKGYTSIERKMKHAERVLFLTCDYQDLPTFLPSVIYCDPPYRGTTGYKTGKFCSVFFDMWAETRVAEGHAVFVSEFNAPKHWDVVWQIERLVSTSTEAKYGRKVDKLFRVRIGK